MIDLAGTVEAIGLLEPPTDYHCSSDRREIRQIGVVKLGIYSLVLFFFL